MFSPFLATPLVALALLAAPGCSDNPTAADTEANQVFTKEELAEMRNSVKSVSEYRKLLKIKTAERKGTAVVKINSHPGKTKPK